MATFFDNCKLSFMNKGQEIAYTLDNADSF